MNINIIKKALKVIDGLKKGEINWKAGKGEGHLIKRKELGHIPNDFTLKDYNNLITSIINDGGNELYLYYKEFFNQNYFAIGDYKRNWEVIVGENGVMETAYEIIDTEYEQHFGKNGYVYLGILREVERNVNDEESK
ncbi:hypothetical protein CIL05_20900 [Virgibacillus profundi]|uniref:Uncharacterized protein n=1 Tax=Virgibacillus profundi TaxID=2024555 RepID=A0A2A2I7N4_9BACI|nr:hypothetical protein [Virgibacillus profundi]PAV27667.1 hypothetical protein CIL05_20900 [Virgibacillus profundi]PXY51997.1 hypothetical protein CIT14_20035 [Virgibacillus profundi]